MYTHDVYYVYIYIYIYILCTISILCILCIYIYICIHTYMRLPIICVYIYVCICICICMCVYIQKYIYIYIYTYILVFPRLLHLILTGHGWKHVMMMAPMLSEEAKQPSVEIHLTRSPRISHYTIMYHIYYIILVCSTSQSVRRN